MYLDGVSSSGSKTASRWLNRWFATCPCCCCTCLCMPEHLPMDDDDHLQVTCASRGWPQGRWPPWTRTTSSTGPPSVLTVQALCGLLAFSSWCSARLVCTHARMHTRTQGSGEEGVQPARPAPAKARGGHALLRPARPVRARPERAPRERHVPGRATASTLITLPGLTVGQQQHAAVADHP
jgi:hypothetical protein